MMNTSSLLRRSWQIVRQNPFLLVLGLLVVLGTGAGSGIANSTNTHTGGQDFQFDPGQWEFQPFEQMPELANITLLVIAVIVAAGLLIGLAFWVMATIARGGLIAGSGALDAGQGSSLGQAFSAGWKRGWTLLAIGLLPGFAGLLVLLAGLVLWGLVAGVDQMVGIPTRSIMVTVVIVLAAVGLPLTTILGLLRTFADRACMLEGLGALAAYRRGFTVLGANLGRALLLFLAQIGIGLGIGLLMFIPGIVLALCCLFWPIFAVIQSAMTAFFSTLWTVAWRDWTGMNQAAIASR